MPELEPDAFVITDERARALLKALLDKWSSPAVAPLLQSVTQRITSQVAMQMQPAERSFETAKAHFELLDRAGTIFIDRLEARVSDALRQAIADLADDAAVAAVAELPEPKPKRRRRATEHSAISVWLRSVAIAQAIFIDGESRFSQTFIATLYYWECDTTKDGAIALSWQRYRNVSQEQRDSRLRAYSKLLQNKGIKFEDIETVARRLVAGPIE